MSMLPEIATLLMANTGIYVLAGSLTCITAAELYVIVKSKKACDNKTDRAYFIIPGILNSSILQILAILGLTEMLGTVIEINDNLLITLLTVYMTAVLIIDMRCIKISEELKHKMQRHKK